MIYNNSTSTSVSTNPSITSNSSPSPSSSPSGRNQYLDNSDRIDIDLKEEEKSERRRSQIEIRESGELSSGPRRAHATMGPPNSVSNEKQEEIDYGMNILHSQPENQATGSFKSSKEENNNDSSSSSSAYETYANSNARTDPSADTDPRAAQIQI